MEFRPVTSASTSHPVPLKVRIAPEVLKIIAVVTAAFAYYSTSQMYLYAAAGALILSYIAEIIRNSRTPTSYYPNSLNSSASLVAPSANAPSTPPPPVSPSTYIPAPPPLPTPSPAPGSPVAASLLPPPDARNNSSLLPPASTQPPAARPSAPIDFVTAIRTARLRKTAAGAKLLPVSLKRSNSSHDLGSAVLPEPTLASPALSQPSSSAFPPSYVEPQRLFQGSPSPSSRITSRRKDTCPNSDSEREETPARKPDRSTLIASTRQLFELPVAPAANGTSQSLAPPATSSPSKPLSAVPEDSSAAHLAASAPLPASAGGSAAGDEEEPVSPPAAADTSAHPNSPAAAPSPASIDGISSSDEEVTPAAAASAEDTEPPSSS